MAKGYKIRWRDKDTKKIQNTVRNFNAKVKRLIAKNPSNAHLYPDTIKMKDVKSSITNRQDFNRELNKIKRFSRRGAEEIKKTDAGVKTTKYEIKEVSIMRAVVNRKRKADAKRLGLTIEKGLKTQVEKQNLAPKRAVKDVSPRDFKKFKEALEKEIQSGFSDELKEIYVGNYIKGLYNKLGFEQASKIVKLIEQQDDDFIVDNSLGNPFLTIDFIYDPLEVEVRADAIYHEWLDILEDNDLG